MGHLLHVGSYNYGTTSITLAEARAMRDGILTTIQAGYHHGIVEGGNQTVIHAAGL